jgi:F0F1-type ATP synthase delta subunit
MNENEVKTHDNFILPPNVVTRIDVSRLVSEMERVDNEMTASAVREKTGSEQQAHPVLSEQLNQFLNQNGLNIDSGISRATIVKELRQLKDKVPILHMTFAVTADAESLQQLTSWVRETIHPQAVIDVGLQPGLVAGVFLRTPNHVHDFSMRGALKGRHGLLVEELEALRGGK